MIQVRITYIIKYIYKYINVYIRTLTISMGGMTRWMALAMADFAVPLPPNMYMDICFQIYITYIHNDIMKEVTGVNCP